MYINSLALKNFRNYESLELSFGEGINILYGDNAQGKTNVLEAVYLCATTRSHRRSKDKEMIRFGEEESHLRMMLSREGVSHKVDMHLRRSKAKGIAIDGIPVKRSGELLGLAHMICFSPEDLSMIKNGPAERRRFLDMELCQMSRMYYHNISRYNRIVNQRNNLLRQIGFEPSLKETLDIWDEQMVSCGCSVIEEREAFIDKLNERTEAVHAGITAGKEHLKLVYRPSTDASSFAERLAAGREMDLRMKMTGVGPHRDDFAFMLGDVDLRKFGSQGQQRTAALSLKLAEIDFVRETSGDQPVLLLDDVMSELDSSRQNDLIRSMQDIQTIITCTGLEDLIRHRMNIDHMFYVENGSITQK